MRYQPQRWYTNTTKGGRPTWHALRPVCGFEEARDAVLEAVRAESIGMAESAYRVAILEDDEAGEGTAAELDEVRNGPGADIPSRLEYLRGEIRAERISYGEIMELQNLADHIAPSDYELLGWAGIESDEETIHTACHKCGQDIEGDPAVNVWRDRGGGTECLPTGERDENGVLLPPPTGDHEPYILPELEDFDEEQAEQLGRLAYHLPEMRLVPRSLLVAHGVPAARAWYRGWDAEADDAAFEALADGPS